MGHLKVLFMGSPDFALPSLEEIKKSSHSIAGIITRPDNPGGRGYKRSETPVKQWAKSKGLPVYQPQRLIDEDFFRQMRNLAPDIIVNVAFGRIVPQKLLDMPEYGSINLHPSLLPLYRGASPVQRAIFNGDSETGVTVLFMEEEIDAGDIILQERETILPDDTTGELLHRLSFKGSAIMHKALDLIASGDVPRIPQKDEESNYAPLITADEEVIHWGKTSWEIHNKVRGLSPAPGAYTLFKGSRLKIWETKLLNIKEDLFEESLPGMVVSLDTEGFRVKTGDGVIMIKTVQLAGKKKSDAGDFWRGYRINENMLLGK